MKGRIFIFSFILVLFSASVIFSQIRIQPWTDNPRYWSAQGNPILLLGASDDDNLFQWPPEMLKEQLDMIRETGANYVRNTMSDRQDRGFEQYPFQEIEDGIYDLEKWNPVYWERFERFLDWTDSRQIFVQLEVWDRFDYSRENWISHPYNPVNNINYTGEESGLAKEYPEHPGRNLQPFFFTTPRQRNNRILLKYQKSFVEKILSYSLQHGHVLYCMDNETSGEEEWGRFWAELIKQRAKEKGVRVYLTEMWDAWDIKAQEHRRTFDHPDFYDFVDVSQNNHNKGDEHWENAIWVRDYLSNHLRPINTVKTYGADNNKFGHSDQDGIERFIRHILAGFASARFHRPPSGLGLSVKARNAVRSVRLLQGITPLWNFSPQSKLLGQREENEAYLSADPGRSYIVYFTRNGSVSLQVEKGSYRLSWIRIDDGKVQATSEISAQDELTIQTPNEGNWLAVIVKTG
jgi:hypothetical protein